MISKNPENVKLPIYREQTMADDFDVKIRLPVQFDGFKRGCGLEMSIANKPKYNNIQKAPKANPSGRIERKKIP